jgi:hypothetical protein
MANWILKCPACGTRNDVPANELKVRCGNVSCTCVCKNCRKEFKAESPYWRWLELYQAPSPEDKSG